MTITTPAKKLHDASPILLFFVLVTIAAVIGQTWWAVVQDRHLTLEAEKDNGLLTARLLDEHANQTIQDAERKLHTIASTIHANAESNLGQNEETVLRNAIREGLQDTRFLTALQFVNLQGRGWVTSLDYPAHQFDSKDRSYITWLLQHPESRQAKLGHPFRRFYDGRLVLPIGMNLYGIDGKHIGVISTDINIPYFADVYARVAKNSQAMVTLLTQNGDIIIRFPDSKAYATGTIAQSPVLEGMNRGAEEGSIQDSAFLGDNQTKPRLFAWRKMNPYPIVTVFGRDLEQILGAWQQRTRDRILFSGATIAFIGLLSYLLLLHIRRLRQSEQLLRSSEAKFIDLFQRSPVPMALLSVVRDCYLEVNDALLIQSGFGRDDLINKTPAQVDNWANIADRQPYLDLLFKQRYVDRYEVRFRRKDGQIDTCLLSARLIESGGEQLILFSPIDVTRQREIENEIRELNIQLEQRVRQRTINLEEANQELADALSSLKNMQGELLRSEKMAALGSLVAGVAHELNTPIGNSVTLASTLLENAQFTLDEIRNGKPRRAMLDQSLEAATKGAEILVRNLHRASELVTSFKQVAVDQSSNHRRRFDLHQVLEEVVLTLQPLYKKTPYAMILELDENIVLESYPGPLGQIVTNFVTNSLAHAFEGRSEGYMKLVTRRASDDQVEIIFSDDGIGISPEYIARVFDPFFTTKLGQGGSGLGMHIVYNLVTGVLGGKIALDSQPGQGTTLTMTLPLLAPDGGDGTVT